MDIKRTSLGPHGFGRIFTLGSGELVVLLNSSPMKLVLFSDWGSNLEYAIPADLENGDDKQ